ncbi:MAG: dihydrodipicolinate synthase family protein [Pirellulaceae bacterium]
MKRLNGLIAATYTPTDESGNLELSIVPQVVEFLIQNGVRGLYVCGSTGEGMTLTSEERRAVAEAYTQACNHRIPVIVQVGHNSIRESMQLAQHAQEIGADAVSATCPSYFKIGNVNALIETMKPIADSARDLPFYYYHIPMLTGSAMDIVEFMRDASKVLPNLTGLKYTDTKLHEFQICKEMNDGQFDVVWGCDEMLLGALATGARAAIGSTYNVAAGLNNELIRAFTDGDLELARRKQSQSIEFIRTMYDYPFHSAMKHLLSLGGMAMGSCRLPQMGLSSSDKANLEHKLEQIGFFEWSDIQR